MLIKENSTVTTMTKSTSINLKTTKLYEKQFANDCGQNDTTFVDI